MIQIKNKDNLTEIHISGDIVDDSWKSWNWFDEVETYPDDIRNMLNGISGPVNVIISSGGGDLFAGMAISNMLQRYEGHTTAIIDGLAASAASVIAFGCDEIKIPSNAYLMIHKPSVSIYGNSDELLKWAETLETLQEGILNTYMNKTKDGITEDTINNLINDETWLTGKKASEFFNVQILNETAITNALGNSVYNYMKTPSVFLKENTDSLRNEIEMALAMY